MDFVTGSIQEARVDKDHPFPGPVDTFRQIEGGTTFLIHDAYLEGVWAQPKNLLDTGEHFHCETDLVGSVHFGLYDVHAAFSGVAQGTLAAQFMERTGGGEQGVQYALGNLPAIGSEHRVVGHQVPDIAYKEQAASGQRETAAIRGRELSIRIQGASLAAAPLAEGFCQIALHQSQPVSVDHDLVLGVHRRHRVLTVLDGGQGRLKADILYAGRVGFAHGMGRVNLNFNVQTVVPEQD